MFGLSSLFSGIANVLSVVVTKPVPGLIKIVGAAIARYGQPMSDFSQIIVSNLDFYSKAGHLDEFASLIHSDPKTFAELVNYMENKNLSTEKNDDAFDKLVEMEKKSNPDAPDTEIWTAVSNMKK